MRGAVQMQVTTIGLDIAKNVFQVHGIDANEKVVVRKQLRRSQVINALRAHLAELGIVAAKGDSGVKELLAIVADDGETRLPIDARASVIVLAAQLEAVQTVIGAIEKRIKMQHRSNEASQRV